MRKLLLKCILSEGVVSRDAFARWEESILFDDLDFESFKLLPAAYLKCLRYSWESRYFLRLKGAYRRTWTENQLLLTHLHDLFSKLVRSKVEFLITDETIQFLQIHNDFGIYSLQHFSLIAPFAAKTEFDNVLLDSGWESIAGSLELSFCQKDKAFSLRINWLDDVEFNDRTKNAGNILIKDISRPIVSLEEQMIGFCEKEFVGFREEQSRWQFIVGETLYREVLDHSKLISIARERDVAHHVAEMFQSLMEDFDVNVEEGLIVELRKNSRNRLSSVSRKAKLLWQCYRTLKKHGDPEIGFRKFLAQRWKADTNAILLKRAAEAGARSLHNK